MKTRHIAALAVSGLAAAVIAPAAAQAATGSTTHFVSGGAARPSTAEHRTDAFRKYVVHSRPDATVNGAAPALTATAVGAETFNFVEAQPPGTTSTTLSYSIDFGDGSTPQSNTTGAFTYKYAWAGTYTAKVTVTDQNGIVATDSVTVTTFGSDYTPYGPARILDTRNGTGAAKAAVGANGVVKLKIAGAGNQGNPIPAGVTAVAMNVTVTDPTAAGFITAYPDGSALPNASNINYGPGQTIPGLVIVQVGADGVVNLQNTSKGSVHLVADVVGYYTQTKASQYVAINPDRLLDTRDGTGTNGVVRQIPGGGSITVPVAGTDGGDIPGYGVTAIAANVTVTNPQTNGFITAYPTGESLPDTSNVNYGGGQTLANEATIPVGTDGKIVVHNTSAGPVDVVIDVSGYFSDLAGGGRGVATNSYWPTTPVRDLDTRNWGYGPLLAYHYYYELGAWSVDSGVTSAVFNATVTNPQTNGFLTLYPVDTQTATDIPNTSNINFGHDQTVANLAFVPLGAKAFTDSNGFTGYWFGAFNYSNGTTDLVLDQEGVFLDN